MKFNGALNIMTAPYKLYAPGEAPIRNPGNFKTYYDLADIPSWVMQDLALAYTKVYAEPPWNETWHLDEVREKMERELNRPFVCLTVMEGNSENKVGGFCWGGLVPVNELPRRAVEAHTFKEDHIEDLLEKKINNTVKGSRVFVFDDIAVLREFRNGLSPIRFLTRPILEMAVDNRVFEGVSWTTWNAKIAPIVYYLGLSTVIAEVEGIAFLYIPNVTSLCKVTQNLSEDTVKKFIRLADKLTALINKKKRSKPKSTERIA